MDVLSYGYMYLLKMASANSFEDFFQTLVSIFQGQLTSIKNIYYLCSLSWYWLTQIMSSFSDFFILNFYMIASIYADTKVCSLGLQQLLYNALTNMLYAYIIYPYSFNLNPYKNLYDDFIISNIIYEPLASFLFYNQYASIKPAKFFKFDFMLFISPLLNLYLISMMSALMYSILRTLGNAIFYNSTMLSLIFWPTTVSPGSYIRYRQLMSLKYFLIRFIYLVFVILEAFLFLLIFFWKTSSISPSFFINQNRSSSTDICMNLMELWYSYRAAQHYAIFQQTLDMLYCSLPNSLQHLMYLMILYGLGISKYLGSEYLCSQLSILNQLKRLTRSCDYAQLGIYMCRSPFRIKAHDSFNLLMALSILLSSFLRMHKVKIEAKNSIMREGTSRATNRLCYLFQKLRSAYMKLLITIIQRILVGTFLQSKMVMGSMQQVCVISYLYTNNSQFFVDWKSLLDMSVGRSQNQLSQKTILSGFESLNENTSSGFVFDVKSYTGVSMLYQLWDLANASKLNDYVISLKTFQRLRVRQFMPMIRSSLSNIGSHMLMFLPYVNTVSYILFYRQFLFVYMNLGVRIVAFRDFSYSFCQDGY